MGIKLTKEPELINGYYGNITKNSFLKKVYLLLSISLVFATIGSFIGLLFVSNMISNNGGFNFFYWGIVILEFILLFSLYIFKKIKPLNLLLLNSYTFLTGFTLAPLLSQYISNGMGYVITEAFLLTSIAFGSLTLYSFNTKRDFTSIGKILFVSLIIVTVAVLLNLFFHSSILSFITASISSVLFSLYIIYDTQLILKGNINNEIEATISLYIDILNLFISLLEIIGVMEKKD